MGRQNHLAHAPGAGTAPPLWFQGYCRAYQGAFAAVSPLLPWRQPRVLRGVQSANRLAGLLQSIGLARVLLVTDAGLAKLGLAEKLARQLQKAGIAVAVYSKTSANPTIEDVEAALAVYKEQQCQGLVALGGGSPIDCAKMVGARLARPGKTVPQLKGLFRVLRKIPPLVAVPTTAGTGSETTVAAVVVNPQTHDKFAVNDLSLIPGYAVLDPCLTASLPPQLTATTGMDVLTHAVEAYVGRSNTKWTRRYALLAAKKVFGWLPVAVNQGGNLAARSQMQLAAYMAGVAFTRAYVGNVHALAHALGGRYGIPHGLANAVLLPKVLAYYGPAAQKSLAEMAVYVGLPAKHSQAEQSRAFIRAIDGLNRRFGIPEGFTQIQLADIPAMANHAFQEANPLYPVPQIFSRQDFSNILTQLQTGE